MKDGKGMDNTQQGGEVMEFSARNASGQIRVTILKYHKTLSWNIRNVTY